MGGRELLRRPRTRHDSHTIVASTRARSRSTNLSIYLIRYRANRRARLAPTAASQPSLGVLHFVYFE